MTFHNKTYGIITIVAVATLITGIAYAATPTLSLSNVNGDLVQVNVTGDANSSVLFYYNVASSSGLQVRTIGTTSASGSLSTTVSSNSFGVNSGSLVYVFVNGTQSPLVTWPSASSAPSLSQTSVTLVPSQSTTVSSYGGTTSLYVLSNSNASVANVVASGAQIIVTANTIGYTAATVCYQGNSSNCTVLSVTVQSTSNTNGSQSTISFSQNNLYLLSGANQTVTIYGSGGYTMANNTNQNAVSVALNVSTVTVYAIATGNTSITICEQSDNACGVLSVVVNGAASNPVTFSQTNPLVPIGQNTNITIYGGTNSYYISSNSNSNIISSTISGSTITLTGNAMGAATISVCSAPSNCGTLVATVGGSSTPITFSQTNPTVSVGQSISVSVYGGVGSYYIQSNSSSNILQASVSGSTLTLIGLTAGSAPLVVCSSGGGCGTLQTTVNPTSSATPISFSQSSVSLTAGQVTSISVYGSGGYYISGSQNNAIASVSLNGSTALVTATGPGVLSVTICQSNGQCGAITISVSSSSTATTPVSFSVTSPIVPVGQSMNISVYGGSGSYYLGSNSMGNVLQASMNGSTLTLVGLTVGSSSITVCSSGDGCGTVYGTVISPSPTNTTQTSTSTDALTQIQALQARLVELQALAASQSQTESGTASGSSSYKFLNPLKVGSSGTDVRELQKRLTKEGFFSGSVTGYYGSLTKAAVMKYQTKHGLTPLGNVGPGTRKALNSE